MFLVSKIKFSRTSLPFAVNCRKCDARRDRGHGNNRDKNIEVLTKLLLFSTTVSTKCFTLSRKHENSQTIFELSPILGSFQPGNIKSAVSLCHLRFISTVNGVALWMRGNLKFIRRREARRRHSLSCHFAWFSFPKPARGVGIIVRHPLGGRRARDEASQSTPARSLVYLNNTPGVSLRMDDYKAPRSELRRNVRPARTEKETERQREYPVTSVKGIHLPPCGTLATTFPSFKSRRASRDEISLFSAQFHSFSFFPLPTRTVIVQCCCCSLRTPFHFFKPFVTVVSLCQEA